VKGIEPKIFNKASISLDKAKTSQTNNKKSVQMVHAEQKLAEDRTGKFKFL